MNGIERCPECRVEINGDSVKFYSKTEGGYKKNIRVCLNCGWEETVESIPVLIKKYSQNPTRLSLESK